MKVCIKIIIVDGDMRKVGVSRSKEVGVDERRKEEEEMRGDKIQTAVKEADRGRERNLLS